MKQKLIVVFLLSSLTLVACSDESATEEVLKKEEEKPVKEIATDEPEEQPEVNVEELEQSIEENLSTEELIEKYINDAFGEKTNTDKPTIEKISLVEGSLSIELNGDDNITVGYIRDDMLSNSKKILEHIKSYDDITDDVFIGYIIDMVDSYGNTEPTKVLNMRFTQETLDKINFDSFSYESFDSVADNYYLHQALK